MQIMIRIYLLPFLILVLLFAGCSSHQEPQTTKSPPHREKADASLRGGTAKKKDGDVHSPVVTLHPRLEKKKVVKKGPAEEVFILRADKKKKVFEFVTIRGKSYEVPHPWRGAKVAPFPLPQSHLVQVPLRFTWQQSGIYLEKETRDAFVTMAVQALEDGIHLQVHSGFRSISYQRKIFENLMDKGRSWADLVRYVAPPGYSEHATGMVVDIYPSDWRFATTREHAWLMKNAARFGFVQSYPQVSVGGFPWEAWHWRFRGELRSGKAAQQKKATEKKQ